MSRLDAPAPAPLRFRKMHGLGNDFVVIDARSGDAAAMTPALARALGDRRRGVGFDQLAMLSDAPGADVAVAYWNADGSRAAACGNATRCVAALMLAEGLGPDLRIEVAGRGVLEARRREDGLIEVDMGAPATGWRDVPLSEAADALALPLPGNPAALSMGNPHCVHFVADLAAVDWRARGAEVETHPLFPERTNVQFAQVIDRGHVRARVWERGVGPTLASGSSACAIAVAGALRGLTDRRVAVELEGGTLEIDWRADGHVLMAGPVADVFTGEIAPEFLAALA
ncbi:MAG: diaminopimelate epimerase [Rubrimonas sp.]|uniref:diaminopimelate epimerase n=1 Tax=Rubrimonas sp. TaxID=2036015 RepID=UPI002FDC91B6